MIVLTGCSGRNYDNPSDWVKAELLGDESIVSIEEKSANYQKEVEEFIAQQNQNRNKQKEEYKVKRDIEIEQDRQEKLKRKAEEKQLNEKVRLAEIDIFDISFSYSEEKVSSLYLAAKGFCRANKSSYATGETRTQLVCEKRFGRKTYYYFRNHVMVSISD